MEEDGQGNTAQRPGSGDGEGSVTQLRNVTLVPVINDPLHDVVTLKELLFR